MRHGELDKALSALRYVSTCLPAAEFVSIAFALAVSCEASASVARFIAAHRLVVESGHPDVSIHGSRLDGGAGGCLSL